MFTALVIYQLKNLWKPYVKALGTRMSFRSLNLSKLEGLRALKLSNLVEHFRILKLSNMRDNDTPFVPIASTLFLCHWHQHLFCSIKIRQQVFGQNFFGVEAITNCEWWAYDHPPCVRIYIHTRRVGG